MTSRVVVLDYGFGNVRSAVRALERAGAQVELTDDDGAARSAAGLVVPGVGAFAAVMSGLRRVGGDVVVRERLDLGRPVLGICVGMQVMFAAGEEHGVRTEGLGEWDGVVDRLQAPVVPHMGWSTVAPPADSALFAGLADERFYFVHSYAAHEVAGGRSGALRVTWSAHGQRFVAAVEDGPLAATQFHPEKSGEAGARLLRNWLATL